MSSPGPTHQEQAEQIVQLLIETSPQHAEAIEQFRKGRHLFLTGVAGTGKSHLSRQLLEWCRQSRVPYLVTGTTGVSALILGGKTVHSALGLRIEQLPLELLLNKFRNILRAYRRAQNKNPENASSTDPDPVPWITSLLLASFLIIDEVSMMSAYLMETADAVLRVIRDNPAPFGGLQVLFVGDFRQLPPVYVAQDKKQDPRGAIMAFNSPLWHEMNIIPIHLQKVFRQEDASMAAMVYKISMGEQLCPVEEAMLRSRCGATLNDGKLMHIMVARKDVCQVNQTRYAEQLRKTRDRPPPLEPDEDEEDDQAQPTEQPPDSEVVYKFPLSRWRAPVMPQEQLEDLQKEVAKTLYMDEVGKYGSGTHQEQRLCVGCRVMLVVNMHLLGLVNGHTGTIVRFEKSAATESGTKIWLPVVEFDHGPTVPVTTFKWERSEVSMDARSKEVSETPSLRIEAVPLVYAWASTVHKVQGATLTCNVEIDCRLMDWLTPATFYVALSRCKKLDQVSLKNYKGYKAKPEAVQLYRNGLVPNPLSDADVAWWQARQKTLHNFLQGQDELPPPILTLTGGSGDKHKPPSSFEVLRETVFATLPPSTPELSREMTQVTWPALQELLEATMGRYSAVKPPGRKRGRGGLFPLLQDFLKRQRV